MPNGEETPNRRIVAPLTALTRVEENLFREVRQVRAGLEEKIKHERELRELTERSDKIALDKAEKFITEKTQEHNNLLTKMERDAATYITKEELANERKATRDNVRFLIAIGGAIVFVLNFLARYFFPGVKP